MHMDQIERVDDGHENDRPSKFQDMKLQDKQRKSNNRDYIRMQFL